MNKTVVALLGLALLVAPAIPSLAQGEAREGDDRGSSPACPASFEGDHWAMGLDAELPGAVDVHLVAANATLAGELRLPGEELHCQVDDDRARLFTGQGMARFDDRSELRMNVETEDNASAELVLASNVSVEETADGEDEDRYRLTPEGGPTLVLSGEQLSRDGRTIEIGEDARLSAAQTPADRSQRETNASTQPDDGEDEAAVDERRDDRRDRAEDQRRDRRPTVREGSYDVGAAELRLVNDTLRNLQWRNVTLLRSVELPGLTPAEERHRGPQLRLEGEDARVRLAAAGGLMARVEADAGVSAEIGQDVEVRQENDHVFLATDDLLVVVDGEDVELRGSTLQAEELRLHARSPQHHDDPVWRQDQPSALSLPHTFEGRFIGFQLTEDGIGNLSVHGTPIGEVSYAPADIDRVRQRGAHFEAEGEAFELRVQDTPAAQLRLEADNLTADLSERTTLPSGAQVHVRVEDDELRLRVDRPAGALANETVAEHRPAPGGVERTEGPAPGLQTTSEEGQLGVQSTSTSTITTSFTSDAQGPEGNVSLQLGLARAMLIEDTNGNSRVDVGEPAVAERPLTNGTVNVEDDELVHRFPLWSGNLTVTVEPGEETAKVTYEATNLSAPPGTLFVLETNVGAPADANLTPTDTGVIVDNGTMQAEFSATGPVTVDGEDAWAQRSIFVDGDDRVRVLLAYPAGDNITHDPTVAVQSSAVEVAERLAASPYAILLGAGLAGLLVAGTALHRRRQRPGR